MRIGKCELFILEILVNNDGKTTLQEVKEKLSGHGRLKVRRMGRDTYHKAEVEHKAIVRATKTLEEKGLILRKGMVGYYNPFSRITRLILTNRGREEYLKRLSPTMMEKEAKVHSEA